MHRRMPCALACRVKARASENQSLPGPCMESQAQSSHRYTMSNDRASSSASSLLHHAIRSPPA